MITKKKQCELGIEFANTLRNNVGRNGLSKKEVNYQVRCHKKMSRLNRRGTDENKN